MDSESKRVADVAKGVRDPTQMPGSSVGLRKNPAEGKATMVGLAFDSEAGVTLRAPLPRVKPSVRSVRSTLIAVYLLVTMLLTNLSFTILAPFLALESAKRDVNGAAMGFIFSVNYLICVVACPVFGGMLQAKQVGSTTLMAFGTITIGIGSALFGLVMPGITRPAPFIAMGLLFRAMVGLGSAAVDTAGTSLMVTLAMDAGYKHVGQAVGLVETSMAIGEALGPIFGGFMYEAGGFRAPFLAAGFFVSFSGPTLLIIMRHLTAAQPEHESKGGFLAEQMVVYKKTAEVFSHLRMFILVLPTFLGCSSMTWLDATLAPFAASRFHMKPHEVGFAFTLFNVVYAIACPLAGWVAGMVGDVRTLGAGLLACSISFFMVGPTPLLESLPGGAGLFTVSGPSLLYVGVAVLGIGQGFCFVPALPALFATYSRMARSGGDDEDDMQDMMVGILNSVHFLGGGIGAPLGASLEEAVGFRWASTFLAVVMLGALVILNRLFRI